MAFRRPSSTPVNARNVIFVMGRIHDHDTLTAEIQDLENAFGFIPTSDVIQIPIATIKAKTYKSLGGALRRQAGLEQLPLSIEAFYGDDMVGPSVWSKRLKDFEVSKKYGLNGRVIGVPLLALLGASLFFVYARSSVYSAKRNAERHRVADGGQISWYKESKRRHGMLEKPEETFSLEGLTRKKADLSDLKGSTDPSSTKSKNEAVIEARRRALKDDKYLDN